MVDKAYYILFYGFAKSVNNHALNLLRLCSRNLHRLSPVGSSSYYASLRKSIPTSKTHSENNWPASTCPKKLL